MKDLQQILSCEKDIDFKALSLLKRHGLRIARSNLVSSYYEMITLRKVYIDDLDNSIITSKKIDDHKFTDYVNIVHKFYNCYLRYASLVAYFKGAKLCL